jgi:hypothetical protein
VVDVQSPCGKIANEVESLLGLSDHGTHQEMEATMVNPSQQNEDDLKEAMVRQGPHLIF